MGLRGIDGVVIRIATNYSINHTRRPANDNSTDTMSALDITKLTDDEVQILSDNAWSAYTMAQAVADVYPDRKRSAKKMMVCSAEEANRFDAELRRRGALNTQASTP